MSIAKLTDAEARQLIAMAKQALIEEISFPSRGKTKEFEVIGDSKTDIFTISIFRGRISGKKYNLGARIAINGTMLLELHINPNQPHINPNGEKIIGNHWHIYSEEYGRAQAFSAPELDNDTFVETTIEFLNRFNVIKQPTILFQLELV